jgi:hypothetical protein
MSYGVHITRIHPATPEPRTISLEEWLAYVNSDGEMSLKGHGRISSPKGEVIEWDAPGLAEWTDPLTGKKAYFDLASSGRVSVTSPSQATLVKMFKVAEGLGAVVRGDANEYYDASGETTPHPQYTGLFITIDEHVRARHHCFVAECFLNSSATEWVICIQPTEENTRPHDRYAYKYFRLSLEEAEEVCTAKAVRSKLMEKIDSGLQSLGDSVPG